MQAEFDVLREIKGAVITFLDELIEIFPEQSDLVKARILFNDQLPVADVVAYFCVAIMPHREKIRARDEGFFLRDEEVFKAIKGERVLQFRRLWESPRLDQEDRETIWKWFQHFARLAEKWQKTNKSE